MQRSLTHKNAGIHPAVPGLPILCTRTRYLEPRTSTQDNPHSINRHPQDQRASQGEVSNPAKRNT